ncbi:hypothetical protein DB347_15365 [Opitutaceae bacterium EW11]|nr:hypothetical protein DB347_15365 [Opitutaceae bacterium EW11]
MANASESSRPDDAASSQRQPDPDRVEQEVAEHIDNIVPSYGYKQVPMIGIGGSAGAIAALQAFFQALPKDSGVVVVVVLHLSPDHESILPEMIQKWTSLPVKHVSDGQKAEVNHVYVIPPGKYLTTQDGRFRLTELDREHGRRVAVDLFFRSMADTYGPHAAAVVLSGADGDGPIGIKRIKERGGLTIAQDPEEAEHPSMPRAAIETGMVDWVLRAAQMPKRILEYVERERRLKLPPEEGSQPAEPFRAAANEPESALREILVFLRTRTGRDFTYYKRATIVRRISRRMQVNGLEDMPSYLSFLRTHPGEAGALFKDLLISVTNFFRDQEAFSALETHIPQLFRDKGPSDAVRVWVPACATGEEAYSVAILLLEHARTLEDPPAIQVFGCDLDDDAIQAARAGVFPEAISADVSEDRLRRFFIKEHRGYRVRREVRETVLFAAHDLLKDAPFSRLDLVSCRNLFIYLSREAQARVFEIFHFSLKAEGLLFLGASESVDDGSPLFRIVDKRHRIYARKPAIGIGLPVPAGPSTAFIRQLEQERTSDAAVAAARVPIVVPPAQPSQLTASVLSGARAALRREHDRVSWGELHFKLLERFAPPSVLVNAEYDIQHLSESAGRFLQFIGGQPTMNLLRLVNPALRFELRTALFRAAQSGETTVASQVPMEIEGKTVVVNIRITPAKDVAPDLLLVVFEELQAAALPDGTMPVAAQPEPVVQHLERELEQIKGHLRDTVEQYEASTEELKASNEELQAMNEELRSATEELETSREELQSINEELTTVNQEMKNKVDELGHANSDLQNLMSATAIATLFLDREMRVMRFTASAAPIFNLIPGDIGRPLSDLQHRIDYPDMAADASRVLEKLTPLERQVTGTGGSYFLARMLPYRTVEDRIAGVVLTFVDITERYRVQEELRRHVEELTRFNQVAVGRETRMIELKKEINELCVRLGEPERYPLEFEQDKP